MFRGASGNILLRTGKGLCAKSKEMRLLIPVERNVTPHQTLQAEIDGLSAFQNRALDRGRERDHRYDASNVAFRVSFAEGKFAKRDARPERLRPNMGVAQRPDQDLVRGRDAISSNDFGLHAATPAGKRDIDGR